jgi:hypothetical protein
VAVGSFVVGAAVGCFIGVDVLAGTARNGSLRRGSGFGESGLVGEVSSKQTGRRRLP